MSSARGLSSSGVGAGCATAWLLVACSSASAPLSDGGELPAATSEAPGGGAAPGERDARACGSDGVVRGSLQVGNQQQLDALNGCERVAGDFLLWLFPGIDEGPLLSLRDVDGLLQVSALHVPAEQPVEDPIGGLRSLEEAGELVLFGLTLGNLEPLARLRVVSAKSTSPDAAGAVGYVGDAEHNALTIVGCSGLESLAGLSGLEDTPRIKLQLNPDLKSLSGLTGFTALDELVVSDCPVETLAGLPPVRTLFITASALTNLDGLGTPPLLSVLRLHSNYQLTSLRGGVLPEHMSEVRLWEHPLLESLHGLEQLRSLESLHIYNHLEVSALESLEGLNGLKDLGNLTLFKQARLQHLDGLEALSRVDRLYMSECSALQDLRGAQNATTRSLVISNAPQLASLLGAPRLEPDAEFGVGGAPALQDLEPLVAGDSLSSISIVGTGVRELGPLSNVATLGSLYLQGNPQLRSLPSFSPGADRPFDLEIRDNPALEEWPGLTQIEQGSDVIVTGTGLRDLAWLSGLRSVATLNIANNRHLARLALPELQQATSIAVSDNPKLDDTSVRALQELSKAVLVPSHRFEPPVYIAGNLAGTAPLTVCPFGEDGICDEELGTCAAGSDAADCAP